MKTSLDPNQYSGGRSALKLIGPAIAGVGLLFIIVGMVSFFSAFGGFEPPRYFWCVFVGMPLLFVGIAATKIAYLGTITRYLAGEVAPVGKDVTNYMVAGTKDSIRDVATAVGEGFAAGGGQSPARIRCAQCSAENDAPANFCDNCGAPLARSKDCGKCRSTE